MIEMRRCNKCSKIKSLSNFRPRKDREGYYTYCKDCERKRNNAYNKTEAGRATKRRYNRNSEKYKKYNKERKQKPIAKKQARLYMKKYINKHKKEIKVRQILTRAIRQGLLKPQPCKICGKQITEGHHQDYDKPLQIIWLCNKHHKELERKYL